MSAHANPLRSRHGGLPLVLALCLATGTATAATGDPLAAGRAAFATAYADGAASAEPAGGDPAALSRYPLYPWLSAARLRQALAKSPLESEPAVAGFLLAQGDAPAGRELRRSWLRQLAARQDWSAFLGAWREEISDPALRCQALEAWRATGTAADTAAELAERWVQEAELPAECAPMLAWLRTQPVYDSALIERRLRGRLLDGDLRRARPLIAELPARLQPRYLAWARTLEDPAGQFARLAAGEPNALDDEALRDSFLRYARKAQDDAATRLPALLARLRPALPTAEALTASAALPLAWSRDPRALELFKAADGSGQPLEERALEWRLRAAIWDEDWAQVLAWAETLPERLAGQPRWRYWRARALEALDRSDEARALYQTLNREFDSYGLLASWRLGSAWTPPSRPQAVLGAEARAALAANPAFVRADEAWRLGLKNIASLEWRAAYDSLAPDHRPALVAIANQWGWYDQAVVTATRQGLFDDVPALFQRPYSAQIEAAERLSGTPAHWIYAVMRKESVFKVDAVSSADAIGLLQLLPSTAKLVAKRFQRPAPSREQLFDPAVNVPLGALHLREMVDKYQGRWIMALAAYNAGPRAAERWLPSDGRVREADIWIENIPYNETRVYVQRILLHVAAYRWLETGKPVRANNWLPPVGGG